MSIRFLHVLFHTHTQTMTELVFCLWILALGSVILLLAVLPLVPCILDEYETVVVRSFGKIIRAISGPGVCWTRPIDEFVTFNWTVKVDDRDTGRGGIRGNRFPTNRDLVFDIPKFECSASGGVVVTPDLVFMYRITDAMKAASVHGNVLYLLSLAVQGRIRAEVAKHSAAELLQKDYFGDLVMGALSDIKSTRDAYGVDIKRVWIQNPGLPADFVDANTRLASVSAKSRADTAQMESEMKLRRARLEHEAALSRDRAKTDVEYLGVRVRGIMNVAEEAARKIKDMDSESAYVYQTFAEQTAFWILARPNLYPYPPPGLLSSMHPPRPGSRTPPSDQAS